MRRLHPTGFTLIEVAVAMAIVGIAFAALFGQISQSIASIPRIERSNGLVAEARARFDELRVLPAIRPEQQVNGTSADGTLWSIRTDIAAGGSPDPRHLLRISVAIERDGRQLAFESYRFQPAIPPDTPLLETQLDAIRQR